MTDVLVLGGGPPRHTIEELTLLLKEPLTRGGALRAWVFGSRARGTADEYSDLDLMVEVRASSRPFVERWRDFAAILDVEPALDLLVYTQDELASLQAAGNPLVERAGAEGILIHDGR